MTSSEGGADRALRPVFANMEDVQHIRLGRHRRYREVKAGMRDLADIRKEAFDAVNADLFGPREEIDLSDPQA